MPHLIFVPVTVQESQQFYAPGQPRDSHGRFGSGGGSAIQPTQAERDFAKEKYEVFDQYTKQVYEKWAQALVPGEVEAIKEYQKPEFFQPLAKFLRHMSGAPTGVTEVESTRQLTSLIDTALATSSTPEDLVVYRGVRTQYGSPPRAWGRSLLGKMPFP